MEGFVHTAYHYYTIRSELALRAAPSGHNSMCQNSIKTLLRAMKRALRNETPRPAFPLLPEPHLLRVTVSLYPTA